MRVLYHLRAHRKSRRVKVVVKESRGVPQQLFERLFDQSRKLLQSLGNSFLQLLSGFLQCKREGADGDMTSTGAAILLLLP